MEVGVHFAAKLEPFLLISKSAKGAAACKLVEDATAAPGVFVFAELFEQPHIQELANSEQHAPYYSLLQLFSYKTYPDYLQYKDSLPALNDSQITKLKHLTLASLAMEKRILRYDQLQEVLQISSIRELEDLIIDAIYAEVIRGKLDQKEQQFEVEYTMGRDLEPGKIESLLLALQHWASTTSAVLTSLDEKLVQLSQQAAEEKAKKDDYDKKYQQLLHEVQEKQKEPKIIQRPANMPKSGPTDAGKKFNEARQRREREERERKEREENERREAEKQAKEKEKESDAAKENDKDSMDVDDDSRKTTPSLQQPGCGIEDEEAGASVIAGHRRLRCLLRSFTFPVAHTCLLRTSAGYLRTISSVEKTRPSHILRRLGAYSYVVEDDMPQALKSLRCIAPDYALQDQAQEFLVKCRGLLCAQRRCHWQSRWRNIPSWNFPRYVPRTAENEILRGCVSVVVPRTRSTLPIVLAILPGDGHPAVRTQALVLVTIVMPGLLTEAKYLAEGLCQHHPPPTTFTVDQIPDLTGRVCIVTGGYAGLGKETTRALLNHNAKVYIASRNKSKADSVIKELKEETGREALFLQLDLADLDSVRKSAEEFNSKENALHILFNNAGVMWCPKEYVTPTGYDLQWATNVLGHWYFTELLMPALFRGKESSPDGHARVITTSSAGAYFGPSIGAPSRTANVILSCEVARRYGDKGIVAIAVNPGETKTELQRHTGSVQHWILDRMLFETPMGAVTQLYAGTMPEALQYNGEFMVPFARVAKCRPEAYDPEIATRLWEWMEEQVKDHPRY
ncbi:hypothetical protein NM688_g6029 [Phlebia brevispora]|uniref:Uncharacterized protein n=1 Tax=Phlebia brevispora TaxID=194682 RepID=A0ACC1SKX2_9APHY|nr:hypothetical protein NM688_g6029 [Phlebia brevispora]